MKLFLLDLGRCDVDKGRVLTPGSGEGERIEIPIVGYLIQTDDGTNVLVDTGMHRKHIADPRATYGGTEFGDLLTPIMRPEDDIANRLAEIGLRVSDVDVLVSTHFHFDHAGNHADFGESRIVVQREAHEWAKQNPGVCADIWDLPHLTYECIEGDFELFPGIQLLSSSGHVPGHMSVLISLPNTGPVLLAIDAIYTRENLERDLWSGYHDPIQAYASAHRLADLAKREDAQLITGHDPTQWAELTLAPLYYD